MKKIIFLDIDGTLTLPGSNEPPKSAIQAIRQARINGHKVFICTGRNVQMLLPLLRYEFDGFIASSGGYIECAGGKIFDCPMTEDQRVLALEVFKNNGIIRTIECKNGTYIDEGIKELLHGSEQGNSEFLRWRKQLEKNLDFRPIGEYNNQPIYKLVFLCNELSQLNEPKLALENDFVFQLQEKNEQGIINGELVNRKFDKGQAIKLVCEKLGFKIEDSIGFGDSMNDIEMFRTVGYAVCMENGSSQLKKLANDICPSVMQDGIKRAFEELDLI